MNLRFVLLHTPLLAVILSLALYTASLRGGFVYDDRFTVATNKDVTGEASAWGILVHDYWGQDLRSPMSHKSYRPLTTALFRVQHWAGAWLQARLGTPVPLLFHATSMGAHAAVTAQVHALASALGLDPPRSSFPVPAPLAAALLFAAHPVHVEAVANATGQAELWAALAALCALQLYFRALDGGRGSRMGWLLGALWTGAAAALAKETGVVVMGGMVLAYVMTRGAGFGAEGGAGMRGFFADWRSISQQRASLELSTREEKGEDAAPPTPPQSDQHPRTAAASLPAISRSPQDLSFLLVSMPAACTISYVLLRSVLAGDQLVRIYRQVENPIPFASSRLTRALTTLDLHGRYVAMLLFPAQLSADWSYPCTDYVQSWADWRNARWAIAYGLLWFVVLRARRELWAEACRWLRRAAEAAVWVTGRPGLLPALADSPPPRRSADQHSRMVSAWAFLSLVLLPLLPAANVFFYVGTFLAERLLYVPSVGWSILCAQFLVSCVEEEKDEGDQAGEEKLGSPCPPPRVARELPPLSLLLRLLFFSLLLGAYSWKTLARTPEWASDESIFVAALRVCPRSAKVRMNAAIVARQLNAFDASLAHLDVVERIPDAAGQCDVGLQRALTLLALVQHAAEGPRDALGQTREAQRLRELERLVPLIAGAEDEGFEEQMGGEERRGKENSRISASADRPPRFSSMRLPGVEDVVALLEMAVPCKYAATEAVKTINQILLAQQASASSAALPSPHPLATLAAHPPTTRRLVERWARLLASPHLQRFSEAALYWEQLALGAAVRGEVGEVRRIYASADRALSAGATAASARGFAPDSPARSPADAGVVGWLRACVLLRRPVAEALAEAGGDVRDERALRAVREYVARTGTADVWSEEGEERGNAVEESRRFDGKGRHLSLVSPIFGAPAPRGRRQIARISLRNTSCAALYRPGGSPKDPNAQVSAATFHEELVHSFQAADPDDAALQLAWADVLAARARAPEGLVHAAAGCSLLETAVEGAMAKDGSDAPLLGAQAADLRRRAARCWVWALALARAHRAMPHPAACAAAQRVCMGRFSKEGRPPGWARVCLEEGVVRQACAQQAPQGRGGEGEEL